MKGGGEKGLLRYIWVLLNITRVWNPQLAFQDLPLQTTPFANHPLPTPLNLVLADSSDRYGYYSIHWLMAFLRAFRQFFFLGGEGTSFRPSRRRRAELTASLSDFESKRSLAGSFGLVIELNCTIQTFIRSLTALLILASKGFIREGPRARILFTR